MLTPYDWQEAIGNRAQYIESRLALGAPILGVSIEPGIVILTYRRNARKTFEIYDRLAMAALGQQSDVEAIRTAALDFAHQEGFSRSEQDVTLQRVVTAISSPIKRAFADFSSAPVIAMALFAEIGDTPDQDLFSAIEYDGDFHTRRKHGFLAADPDVRSAIEERIKKFDSRIKTVEKAVEELKEIWDAGSAALDGGSGAEEREGLTLEVGFMDRSHPTAALKLIHGGELPIDD